MVSAANTRQDPPAFRQLSPRLSQLLYYLAVSQLKGEQATREKLATDMKVSLSNVGYLINRLKACPVAYVRSHPDEGNLFELASTDRRPGRLPEVYSLNIEEVVSLPETARLILDARELSRRTGFFNKKLLISRLVRYGLSKKFIEERFFFASHMAI